MHELILKYQQLTPFAQMEVLDFLNFLLLKAEKRKETNANTYKESILKVSVWTAADIAEMEENTQLFNTWKIEKSTA